MSAPPSSPSRPFSVQMRRHRCGSSHPNQANSPAVSGSEVSASRIGPKNGPGEPVAWVTTVPVPDAGRVWSALSDTREETGLVPVMLTDSEKSEGFFFHAPSDVAELDRLDAADVLAMLWDRSMPPDEEEEEFEGGHGTALRAPFSRQFPGLAPHENSKLSMARIHQALGSLPAAPIGLIPARRPADILPMVGWCATGQFQTSLPIASVLRSWEARFGARLLAAGPGARIRLLAERPPGDAGTAERLAADQFAFCDEWGGQGLRDIAGIAASLVDAPLWTFWWD